MAHKTGTGSGFTHSLSKFKDKFKEALSAPGDEFAPPGEGDDSGSDSERPAMAQHFDEAFWVSETVRRTDTTAAMYLRVRLYYMYRTTFSLPPKRMLALSHQSALSLQTCSVGRVVCGSLQCITF